MMLHAQPATPLLLVAFTALVDRQQHALDTFLRHLPGNAEEASDVLQDTLYDAWCAAQAGKKPFVAASNEDQMRRWLFQVAYLKQTAPPSRHWAVWKAVLQVSAAHSPG